MCWNAEASISSFIFGLVLSFMIAISAYRQKKWPLLALSIGWTWVLTMQLLEYFLWIYPPDVSPKENELFSKVAFIFNITQVIVLGLIFLSFFGHMSSSFSKFLGILILLFYTCYMMYYAQTIGTLHTKGSCSNPHLEYTWWDRIPYGSTIYILSLISIFLLVVKPFVWSVATLGSILLLLLMSCIFYSKSVASMWCFFAVIVPFLSFLLYR